MVPLHLPSDFADIRSHLKKKDLVKYRGGAEFQPAVIHQYFEDLKRGTNKEIGLKDSFEIASNIMLHPFTVDNG
jgi:hypothetical protein